uniref:DUF11 domain-containing protein n=1 Tax=Tenacibaculum litopenaei TaxID=396016 RepID=UPI0038B4E5CC
MVKNYLSKYPLWILMFLLLPLGASAQNCTVLSDFTAVCIGASQTYAAETSGGEAHTINSTNNYGCLGSSPNSRWFYFKVDTGGSLVINQTNSNLVDVDGAIWGPFDTLSDMTTSCGSYSTPLACDYDTAAGFNFSLTVTTGKYYALLVSNFSGSATNITLADGGSTAVTDCSPDIQVTKAASGSTFNEGATVNWTLTAKNGGVNDGTNINITDVLPAGLSYVSHSGSGTYSSSTGVWAVGTLSANQTATLTITTTVNANTGPTTITNTITNVSLTETESNALPDTLSDSITINDPCNATASGNTDSDGDNISDACDLDDDNDGILDTDEGCSQNVTLTHDYAIGYFQDGGSNEVNIGGSGGIVSATNFYDGDGPGVNVTKQSISGATIHDVTGVNQSTFAAAQTDGDYMGSTLFTGSQTRTISRFTFPYLGSISQGTFTVAVVIYDPNSGTEHVLDSGIVVSSSNNGDFDMSNVFAMKANATYELRVYFYNASGNVRLDNPRVRTSVVSTTCIDTDGDSTPDYLDLDSDNDGCFDALEADENVTAAQLDGNGRINQASLGGVDANGVPNLVNSGGAADAGGDQGQGATGNEIVATQVVVDATALQNKSVIEGNSTNFTVTSVTATNTTTFTGTPPNTTPNYGAGSAAAASTYQWQEDGVNLSDGGVYSGTTSANLMISNVNGLDGKVYKLIVTHPNNECISIENSATLTVLTDSDGDNVADINDYDDDNDGILDIDERPCFAFSDNFGTGTGSPATSHPNVPAANVQNVRVGTNADFPGQSWYQPNSGADAAGETEGKYLALDNPQGVTPVLMYSETLTVQANEQYSYSLFAAAAREVSGQPLSNYPDVRMQIKDGMGTVLQTINTGAVSLNWTRYEFLFTSTTTSVTIEIYNNNAGSAYNTLLVDEIAISLISCDTDGDGTPDYLDTDSDNDGCLDAIEGNENVAAAQLDGNGRINIATQGGVDANGVPNLVNSGGAADAGGDQGQGLTGNEIVAASAQINTQPSTAVSICTADSGSISVGATSLTTTTFTGTAPARVPDYSGSTPSTTGLVYQWQVQTGGAGAWSNLTNTGIYSDVTTTSLTITNPTTGVSTNKYRVVITSTLNECISLTSGESTLTVNTTPSAPTASAQAFCSADSPTVADLVATGTGIQWYA